MRQTIGFLVRALVVGIGLAIGGTSCLAAGGFMNEHATNNNTVDMNTSGLNTGENPHEQSWYREQADKARHASNHPTEGPTPRPTADGPDGLDAVVRHVQQPASRLDHAILLAVQPALGKCQAASRFPGIRMPGQVT